MLLSIEPINFTRTDELLNNPFLTRLAMFCHLCPVHSWGPSRPGSCFHYHHNSSRGETLLVVHPSLPLTLCPFCLPSYLLPPSFSYTLSKSHVLSSHPAPPPAPFSTLSLLLYFHPSLPCSHYEHIVFAGVDHSHCSTISYWDWHHRKNPHCLGGWASLQWRTLNPSCMHRGQGKPSLSLNFTLSLLPPPLVPPSPSLLFLMLSPPLLLLNTHLKNFLLEYPVLFTSLSFSLFPLPPPSPLPSPHEDPYQWAYSVWWDRWFPEVLEECRRGEDVLLTGKSRQVLGVQVTWLQSYTLFLLSPSLHLPLLSAHLTAVAELYSESPLAKVSSKPRPQGTRKEVLVYQCCTANDWITEWSWP